MSRPISYWCGRHVHRWKWTAELCAWWDTLLREGGIR